LIGTEETTYSITYSAIKYSTTVLPVFIVKYRDLTKVEKMFLEAG